MRKPLNIPHYYCRTNTFKNSFFPNVINQSNKQDEKIKGATSFSLFFKASLLKMVRPHANSAYRIHNPFGIRLLIHLCLGLSHLNEHKFSHNFVDCVNLLCFCSIKPETALHFFLHCFNFLNRRKLFDKIKLLDKTVLQLNNESLLTLLPFGKKMYKKQVNVRFLNASIDYIICSDRFTGSLI